MNSGPNQWISGAFARRLIVLPALVVALSLAFTGAASAQTTFQASVRSHNPKPMPCPNGLFACGSASIAGYGGAAWTLDLTSLTPTTDPNCDNYTATATFMPSDGSTLVLDESGLVCGPGNSGVGTAHNPLSFGHPSYASGSWTVASASGQFLTLTGASGTDALHAAGGTALRHLHRDARALSDHEMRTGAEAGPHLRTTRSASPPAPGPPAPGLIEQQACRLTVSLSPIPAAPVPYATVTAAFAG